MDEARTLNKVKSADGTTIAFECLGQGPALILVSGATADRQATFPLAALLAPHFTAVAYDRRGRGDSGDARPYSVEREIEDIQALMNETGGGKAFVFGHSSGAALTIEAALQGLPFPKMALYEPPYVINDSRPPFPDDYVPTLESLLAEDRRGDAIEYF